VANAAKRARTTGASGYRRRVRREWLVQARAVVGAAVLPLVVAGCTTVVAGSATAVEGPARPAGLHADVVSDECLLTAAEFGELVDVEVRPPEQGSIERADGSRSAGCVVIAGSEPVALVNVYAVRSGVPADYVRAAGTAGRRELPGVGVGAAVIGTAAGPTLQLAGERYLVTILVSGRTPSDAEWRAAAEAALSRLPA
jgi:hypothetical protein